MQRPKRAYLAMSAVLAMLLASPGAAKEPSPKESERLSAHVRAILAADFAADRAELARQAQAMQRSSFPSHARYAEYWTGFAHWRRAINGFNETPAPADLGADLLAACERFRAAIQLDPAWLEPKIALVSSLGLRAYLSGEAPAPRQALIAEYFQLFPSLQAEGAENPRALWIVATHFLAAPPPHRSVDKARATFQRGLAMARAESLRPPLDAWVPAWGSAESLMSLAYLHAQIEVHREVARAYAEGALALAPTWHYVRDILLPQIEALPEPAP